MVNIYKIYIFSIAVAQNFQLPTKQTANILNSSYDR
jgi:hypothetical protein